MYGAMVSIELCVFSNCVATSTAWGHGGGAIFVDDDGGGTINIFGTSFNGNLAEEGGDILADASFPQNIFITIHSTCPSPYSDETSVQGDALDYVAYYVPYDPPQYSHSCEMVCQAGFFNPRRGFLTSDCVACGAGKFGTSVSTGATSEAICEACPAGKFSSSTGATNDETCENCIAGKYMPETGASSETKCLLCGVGKYSNATGITSEANCRLCPSGRYGEDKGMSSSSCSGPCDANFTCAPGSQSPADGCALGYFKSSLSDDCHICPAGRFGDSHRLKTDRCSGPCQRGYICEPGSTSATAKACSEDEFCASGTTSPLACPEAHAKTCNSKTNATCQDSSLCLFDQCTGLKPTFQCPLDEFDVHTCGVLFSSAFLKKGDVGKTALRTGQDINEHALRTLLFAHRAVLTH